MSTWERGFLDRSGGETAAAPSEQEPSEGAPHVRIVKPKGTYDVVSAAHRWLLPRGVDRYGALYSESFSWTDEIWRDTRNIIHTSGGGDPAHLSTSHPSAFVQELRKETDFAGVKAVLAHLEALFRAAPASFVMWCARLVGVTKVEDEPTARQYLLPTDKGLLYEIVLDELRRADDLWDEDSPRPSIRLAAMLRWHLIDEHLNHKFPNQGLWSYWEMFTKAWRANDQDTMLWAPPPEPVFRVVMVPGQSNTDFRFQQPEAAKESRERATGAMENLVWHDAGCPDDEVVLVLLSGGQVRSPASEAEVMARVLSDPAEWPDKVIPSKLRFVRDGLSRHTSNNLRAAGRAALRVGLSNFWVQTDLWHAQFVLYTPWRKRYEDETSWGLSRAERNRLKHIVPMIRRGCGPGVNPIGGRARFHDVMARVFTPAIGDALNP